MKVGNYANILLLKHLDEINIIIVLLQISYFKYFNKKRNKLIKVYVCKW